MAKEKADSKKKIPQITFRCSAETKESIEDLARIGRYENVSALLNEICEEYITANKQRIINFRRTAKPINKPASVTSTPSKPKTPKKPAAQMDADKVTSDGLKGDEGNAENS